MSPTTYSPPLRPTETFLDDWLTSVGKQANDYARCLAEHGQQVAPPEPENFAAHVQHRLSVGAREYGPDAFRTRLICDLFTEVTEEPPDVAAWAFLLSLRLGLNRHESQIHLIRAAALAALAMQELSAARGDPE